MDESIPGVAHDAAVGELRLEGSGLRAFLPVGRGVGQTVRTGGEARRFQAVRGGHRVRVDGDELLPLLLAVLREGAAAQLPGPGFQRGGLPLEAERALVE